MLNVPVKLDRPAAGEEARVTVAAVDVGILNLTRFEAPEPEGWFFGQRRLGIETARPLRPPDRRHACASAARCAPAATAAACRMRGQPAGRRDAGAASPASSRSVPDGTAIVEFQLPDFNGTVRVMAVAWSGDKLGPASKDVIVRDAGGAHGRLARAS